jgi:hypothetical protein
MMNVEQSMKCLEGETEVLVENLPHCRIFNHKSHISWPGLETEPLRWEAGSSLSYGTALSSVTWTGLR